MIEDNTSQGDENKGAPSLSEVLRLQAVALARMSERMTQQQSGGESAPPPRLDRREANLPVLANDSALSDESLPVLNTFRKFLEAERRRARRRIIWISAVFGVGFALVAAGLAWVGRERMAVLRDELVHTTTQVEESKRQAVADMKKVAESAAAASVSLRQDLRKGVLSSHSILSSNLNTKLVGRDAELEMLKEKLSVLEIENAMLSSQLKELADVSRKLQENYAAWIQNEPVGIALPEVEMAETAKVDEAHTLPLLIPSGGQGRTMQMRVPLMP